MEKSEAIKEFQQNIDMPLEVTYQEKRLNLQYGHLKSRYQRNRYLITTLVIRFQNFIVNAEKQLRLITMQE